MLVTIVNKTQGSINVDLVGKNDPKDKIVIQPLGKADVTVKSKKQLDKIKENQDIQVIGGE